MGWEKEQVTIFGADLGGGVAEWGGGGEVTMRVEKVCDCLWPKTLAASAWLERMQCHTHTGVNVRWLL